LGVREKGERVKILVTGGAGFVGSHLVDALLARGNRPVVVDNLSTGKEANLNPSVRLCGVDIRDAAALEQVFARERPELVSHHAAQTDVRRSMADPAFDAQVNLLGFVNLLQLCVKYGVRKVVFASTSAVYPEPEVVPTDETYPIRPLSAYGLSKYVGEQYLRFYWDVYGLRFTIFRYGNVYGPRQDPHGEAGVVAIFSDQMLTGVRPTIFGDGNKTRDYIYIDDVVSANLLAMDGDGDGEIFNLGWGQEVRDFQVFNAVRNALGVQVEPQYEEKRSGELYRIALDSTKAKALLGWIPQVPFEEGVRLTVDYYRRLSEGARARCRGLSQ
jgi:UDP-glucose 4-epimerase